MTRAPAVPRIIAHRGASGSAPENTLAAFRRAAESGARWVEFDAKLTADGVPVVFHDDSLARTTDGEGAVAKTPFEAMMRLDAGSWFGARFAGEPVPDLAAAVKALGELGLGANVEVKPCRGREAETAEAVCRVLRESWPHTLPPPVVSSFREDCLAVAAKRLPDWERALLVGRLPGDWQARAVRLGCRAVHADAARIGEEGVAAVKRAGYPLRLYTVNDPARARTLFAWGADAIFTDFPERLADI